MYLYLFIFIMHTITDLVDRPRTDAAPWGRSRLCHFATWGILIHCICNFCTFTKLQTRLLIIFQWEAPHSRPRETDMLPKRGNRWRGNKQIPSSHRWPGNKYEALLVLIFREIWAAVLHERFKEGYRCDGKGSEKMNFDVDRLVVYTMCTTHQVRQ